MRAVTFFLCGYYALPFGTYWHERVTASFGFRMQAYVVDVLSLGHDGVCESHNDNGGDNVAH